MLIMMALALSGVLMHEAAWFGIFELALTLDRLLTYIELMGLHVYYQAQLSL